MIARLACVLLMASALVAVSAANSLEVTTDKGVISGLTASGVDKWLGVPYAAPPVGSLRFALPEEHAPWTGVLSTTASAPICPQLQIIPGIWSGSEDCLYADIYAPSARNLSQPLPVLVWIYGGGWGFGDALEFGLYDGSNLANLHNIIVVAFNYRLGPLGFLALKAAKDENAAGSVGSYGIYDQQAALRWVQRNIAAFGGNPAQVTVAGESAGGFSTCIHLVSPGSKGLFRAAIMESATCSSEMFFSSQEDSFAWSSNFASLVGCDTTQPDDVVLACVRGKDIKDIMGPDLSNSTDPSGYKPLLFPIMPWPATLDTVLLSDVPLVMMSQGKTNPVQAVIAGTNHDEGTLFATGMKAIIPGISDPMVPGDQDLMLDHFWNYNATVNSLVDAAYPLSSYNNTLDQVQVILRDFFFVHSTSRTLETLSAQGIPCYLYQFNYKGDWIEDPTLGVYHSAELEFVFDNAWPPLVHAFSVRDQTMANTFGFYWSNLIKYLDPNGPTPDPTQVVWPKYDSATLQNLVLDVPASINTALQEKQLRVWDEIAQFAPPAPSVVKEQLIATE